jgi:hypothetical protein
MATGMRQMGAVIFTVITIFPDFRLPGVRRNARMKLNFEFLKFSTLGAQHISQGFQRYFCYQEMLSFAEILIQICGIVTVSYSKFG